MINTHIIYCYLLCHYFNNKFNDMILPIMVYLLKRTINKINGRKRGEMGERERVIE